MFRLLLLVFLFNPKTSVLLPPLDVEKNPRDTVTEILRASASKEHGIVFGFAIEVGTKRIRREELEWRKLTGNEAGVREKGS